MIGPLITASAAQRVSELVADGARYPATVLAAGLLTEDARRGLAVARRLRTGIVHVNNQTVDDEPQVPFGGVKSSGYGRFGGRWGVEAFTATRWVTVAGQHNGFPY